jgi:acyl carrier protein
MSLSTFFDNADAVPQPSPSGAYAHIPTEALITSCLAETLSVDPVDLGAHFVDVGGDSLVAMNLMTRLSEAYGIDLPPILLFEASTLHVLAA